MNPVKIVIIVIVSIVALIIVGVGITCLYFFGLYNISNYTNKECGSRFEDMMGDTLTSNKNNKQIIFHIVDENGEKVGRFLKYYHFGSSYDIQYEMDTVMAYMEIDKTVNREYTIKKCTSDEMEYRIKLTYNRGISKYDIYKKNELIGYAKTDDEGFRPDIHVFDNYDRKMADIIREGHHEGDYNVYIQVKKNYEKLYEKYFFGFLASAHTERIPV